MATAVLTAGRILCQRYKASPLFHLSKQGYAQKDVTKFGMATPSVEGEIVEPHFPFARAKLGPFVQEEPKLGNQYLEDTIVRSYLKRYIPKEYIEAIDADLRRWGDRVPGELYGLHLECERDQPYLEKYTAWGNLQDKIVTGPAWRKLHDIAAEEGLIATAYQRQFAQHSRLYALVKNYLWSPSAGLYSCPLAMTDGAVKIIEMLQKDQPGILSDAYARLTSTDPKLFWTSGQWMTEKRGGSDVANGTETLAVEQRDRSYKLYGYKWFSSATDADMTFTLARVVNAAGQVLDGTKGLSLFFVEVRKNDGQLNNIEVIRLKNKLGTRQLPTAELLLDGTVAQKVSDDGRGVASISDMLKVTRIHNAISAASAMRRMVNMARDYSTRRKAFGKIVKDYPLHIQTLARMEVEVRGAALLCLENARLLGKEDCGMETEDEKNLIRLLVPLSKLYSGKQALKVCTEGLECFGGQGYIEDTGLPSILRDAQVLSIWEGTTNILSLDVLRAIAKSRGDVIVAFQKDIEARLSSVNRSDLEPSATRVKQAAQEILGFLQSNATNQNVLEMAARDLAYSLTRTYTGALMIDHACSEVGTEIDVYAAKRWCEKDLSLVPSNWKRGVYEDAMAQLNFDLVFDGYHDPKRL